MKEVRYWITEDGKRFGDEDEACKHEELLHFQKVKNDIICLDINGEPADPMFPDTVYFLNLRSEDALIWWKNYTDDAGFIVEGVEDVGLYVYSEQTYIWEKLENLISQMLNIKEKLEGA